MPRGPYVVAHRKVESELSANVAPGLLRQISTAVLTPSFHPQSDAAPSATIGHLMPKRKRGRRLSSNLLVGRMRYGSVLAPFTRRLIDRSRLRVAILEVASF